MLGNLLKTPLWKLSTIGAGIVCLVLTALLMSSAFENRDLLNQRATLTQSISDPKTGYIARLAQAQTNVETLKAALVTQQQSFKTESAKQNAVLAQTEQKLAAAQKQTAAMELKLNRFLATGPKGSTLEARVRDIDERAKELAQ